MIRCVYNYNGSYAEGPGTIKHFKLSLRVQIVLGRFHALRSLRRGAWLSNGLDRELYYTRVVWVGGPRQDPIPI